MPRKIIQLHESNGRTRALCDDGTFWQLDFDYDEKPATWKWRKFPEIPQPDPEIVQPAEQE